jgi:hypothetical protein
MKAKKLDDEDEGLIQVRIVPLVEAEPERCRVQHDILDGVESDLACPKCG